MSDMILNFHIFVEGDLTKIGLLLADLAPLPHTGEALILRCLKRFICEDDSEDRLTSVLVSHLLPSQSRPELPGPTGPPTRHHRDTSFPGPNCSPWREF